MSLRRTEQTGSNALGDTYVERPSCVHFTASCRIGLLTQKFSFQGIQPLQQERQIIDQPAPNDAWVGPTAPKFQPEPIEKTWRNDRDPTRRRATFGVLYPLREVTIEKSDDLHTKLPARFEKTKRRSVPGVRFHLRVSNLILSDADFQECKFHRLDNGESKILGTTFKNCTFKRCMFGGTFFRQVTFEGCKFVRCDFGTSKFEECHFLDCNFAQCTAENASFLATEIDPTAFLEGMPAPVYNYVDSVPDGEETAERVAEAWVEVRRKLAAGLLRSNTDIHHTGHADRGLFELKRAEVSARVLRIRTLKEGVARWPLRAAQVFGAWLLLHATKGGTSLSRLFLIGIILVPLYAVLLSHSHVTFMNQDCYLNALEPSLVLQQLARAASLFLAIGYTAFCGGSVATVLLTLGALVGLLWYALVAAVVIHRVYR